MKNPSVYRVVNTAEAKKDLKLAAAYIRRNSPSAAAQWLAQILVQIQTLSRNPERCNPALEAEAFGSPIRQLLFGNGNRGTYRIIFTISEEFVVILHVRHGSMLPKTPED